MNNNQCLDCKIKNVASNFARSKKNMKYCFEQCILNFIFL